jgi:hypothetical protein
MRDFNSNVNRPMPAANTGSTLVNGLVTLSPSCCMSNGGLIRGFARRLMRCSVIGLQVGPRH